MSGAGELLVLTRLAVHRRGPAGVHLLPSPRRAHGPEVLLGLRAGEVVKEDSTGQTLRLVLKDEVLVREIRDSGKAF